MAVRSTTPHRVALATAIGAVLGVGAVSLAGCSAISSIYDGQPTQADYPSWSDVHTINQQTSATLPQPPAFVPHDATQIYVRVLPTGPAILTFVSTQQPDPLLCHPGSLTGKPNLDANWWPIAKPPAEGLLCSSGWRLFTAGGITYGWTPTS
jgi:hypothetical protein